MLTGSDNVSIVGVGFGVGNGMGVGTVVVTLTVTLGSIVGTGVCVGSIVVGIGVGVGVGITVANGDPLASNAIFTLSGVGVGITYVSVTLNSLWIEILIAPSCAVKTILCSPIDNSSQFKGSLTMNVRSFSISPIMVTG